MEVASYYRNTVIAVSNPVCEIDVSATIVFPYVGMALQSSDPHPRCLPLVLMYAKQEKGCVVFNFYCIFILRTNICRRKVGLSGQVHLPIEC
jgi:hypothetical protein